MHSKTAQIAICPSQQFRFALWQIAKSLPFAALIFLALSAHAAGKKAVIDEANDAPKLTAGIVKSSGRGSLPETIPTEEEAQAALVAGANTATAENLAGVGLDEALGAARTVEAKAAEKVDPIKMSEKLPENEIPVLTNAKDTKRAEGSSIFRLIMSLGVLAVALGGASFGLKRWSSKTKSQSTNTRIKILTQHHLGPKKSLVIVQVAGESLLIGMTDQNISMLKTLSLLDEEVPEVVPPNFNSAMDEVIDETGTDDDFDEEENPSRKTSRAKRSTREPEDFAMRGLAEIRDTVSARLKNMRNL